MISRVLEFADEHEMLPGSGLVLVCVSGGADSVCLLEIMRHISYLRGFDIAAVHYNHMLRGDESDRDETFVMEICETHGIALYRTGSDVRQQAKQRRAGIEETARDIRYNFFFDTAAKLGAARIATAHTKNDNAETVIMNLARGTGTNGMSGIAPVRDIIIRPLLCVTRSEVMEFINERGLSYAKDSTNSLDIYTRNKVRHQMIPLFEQLNPRFTDAVFSASEIFRCDEEFIAEIADLFINDCCIGATADAADLAVLPFSVSSRVIRKLYGDRTLSLPHVKDVLALCRSSNPSASLSLPNMVVYREYSRVVFNAGPKQDILPFAPVYPEPGKDFIILGLGLVIKCRKVIYDETAVYGSVHKPFTTFLFKTIDICGKITVRSREEGESIKLKGSGNTKTLKKLFMEKRVPVRKRPLIPVISDDGGVLGIYAMAVSERAQPEPGAEAIVIEFHEN